MKAPAKPPSAAREATLVAVNGARESLSGSGLERVLCVDPAFSGVIVTSERGVVHARAGEVQSETASAVTQLALRSLGEVGEQLGLGRTRAFHASWGAASLSVVLARQKLLVCVGRSHRNAMASFKRLLELWA